MKVWNDKEVVDLFKGVEAAKSEQKALKEAFKKHATTYGRKQNSVRNYYYHEVDNLKGDAKRCKRLGINLSVHDKTHFKSFDKTAEEDLFEEIEKLMQEGLSVRSACLKLSKGDLTLMTRYQNKYQNMKRKLKADNIIQFRQRILTDSDINSLFLGLVKLIKRNALEEERGKGELLLKKAFDELGEKERQIEQLKTEFEKLKTENFKLMKQFKEMDKKRALEIHLNKNRVDKKVEDKV